MAYSIDYINTICTDLGGTGGHTYEIDGLNEICTLLSATAGHTYNIDALNAICTALGYTAGWTYDIEALNTIVVGGTYKYEVHAWADIQQGSKLNQTIDFNLLGTGADETNYIVKLNVHSGVSEPDMDNIGEDIYLDIPVKDDFSDLKFYDNSGNLLDTFVQSHGNYDIIHSNNLRGIVFFNGSLYGISPDSYLHKSINNGASWSKITTFQFYVFLGIDSNGYMYGFKAPNDYKVIRSIDGGANWSVVLDLTSTAAYCLPSSFAEDSLGNLFLGRYGGGNLPNIYKSTDSGANWDIVYTESTRQHVHGIFIDSYQNDAIYAGLDGNPSVIVKSTDNGANWGILPNLPLTCNFVQMASSPTCRLIAGEGVVTQSLGCGIYRSTDDTTWTEVIDEKHEIFGLIYKNGVFYATGDSYRTGYKCVWQSTDDGLTWKTIWMSSFKQVGYLNDFWQQLKNVTPTGATSQIIGTSSYTKVGRIIESDATKKQALVFIKVPNLPSSGMVLKAKNKQTANNSSIFSPVIHSGLSAYYKMNEGSGTTLLDSSGNDKHLTKVSGDYTYNSFGIAHPGKLLPRNYYDQFSLQNTTAKFIGIPDSDTEDDFKKVNDITLILWGRIPEKAVVGYPSELFVKLNTNPYSKKRFGLFQRAGGNIAFYYGNGTTENVLHTYGCHRIGLFMYAVSLSADTIPVAKIYINGFLDSQNTLAFTPVIDETDKWNVLNYNFPAVGNFGHFCYYNRCLTDLEIQQIYAGRKFKYIEPLISV